MGCGQHPRTPPFTTHASPTNVGHMNTRVLLAVPFLAIAIGVSMSGCSSATSMSGSIHTKLPALQLVEGKPGDPCEADDGYSDIASGSQVVVTDPSGKVIGTTTLKAGVIVQEDPSMPSISDKCSFAYSVDSLPQESRYGVHIGNEARGTVYFDPDQLKAANLLLGN